MKSTTMTKKTLDVNANDFWFNGWELLTKFMNIIIGGRGIGKTYSILKGSLESGSKIMYLRRTVTEIELCCTDHMNPYKSLNRDLNRDIRIATIKQGVFAIIEYEEETPIRHLGLAGALSTFGNLRGADFNDIDYVVFDEFINTGTYTMKKEAYLMFNMIETINRNRELLGQPPIKIVLLANSNSLDSDILVEFNIVDIIRLMTKNKEEEHVDNERGLAVYLPQDSPVSDAKKETALYKLTKGTRFYDMAINNEFVDNFDVVEQVDFRRLTPVVQFKDIFIYKDKQNKFIYLCRRKADCTVYTSDDEQMFLLKYKSYINSYKRQNKVKYFDYALKLELDRILKLKIS